MSFFVMNIQCMMINGAGLFWWNIIIKSVTCQNKLLPLCLIVLTENKQVFVVSCVNYSVHSVIVTLPHTENTVIQIITYSLHSVSVKTQWQVGENKKSSVCWYIQCNSMHSPSHVTWTTFADHISVWSVFHHQWLSPSSKSIKVYYWRYHLHSFTSSLSLIAVWILLIDYTAVYFGLYTLPSAESVPAL